MADPVRNDSQRRPAGGPAQRPRGRSGLVLGVALGLLAGLALAVAVAAYMSRTGSQITDKTRRPPERSLEIPPGQEPPDPNRHAQTVKVPQTEPPVAPADAQTAAPPATSGDPPPAAGGESGESAAPGAQPASAAESGGVSTPAAGVAPAEPDRSTYVLQAGAFKGQEDAEGMKLKLALIGFEARIQPAEVNGVTFYRVRVGPFGQLDDMTRARNRLAENGIETSVVRQK